MLDPSTGGDAVDPGLSEWEKECLFWWGRVLTGNHRHWCPEWDFLPIDDTVDEFSVCSCDVRINSGVGELQ